MAAIVDLLSHSLSSNINAVERTEHNVARNDDLFAPGVDSQLWNLLKYRFVELVDDPKLVGLLVHAFSTLDAFDRLVGIFLRLDPDHQARSAVRDEIVKQGRQLRHFCDVARRDLEHLP